MSQRLESLAAIVESSRGSAEPSGASHNMMSDLLRSLYARNKQAWSHVMHAWRALCTLPGRQPMCCYRAAGEEGAPGSVQPREQAEAADVAPKGYKGGPSDTREDAFRRMQVRQLCKGCACSPLITGAFAKNGYLVAAWMHYSREGSALLCRPCYRRVPAAAAAAAAAAVQRRHHSSSLQQQSGMPAAPQRSSRSSRAWCPSTPGSGSRAALRPAASRSWRRLKPRPPRPGSSGRCPLTVAQWRRPGELVPCQAHQRSMQTVRAAGRMPQRSRSRPGLGQQMAMWPPGAWSTAVGTEERQKLAAAGRPPGEGRLGRQGPATAPLQATTAMVRVQLQPPAAHFLACARCQHRHAMTRLRTERALDSGWKSKLGALACRRRRQQRLQPRRDPVQRRGAP